MLSTVIKVVNEVTGKQQVYNQVGLPNLDQVFEWLDDLYSVFLDTQERDSLANKGFVEYAANGRRYYITVQLWQ